MEVKCFRCGSEMRHETLRTYRSVWGEDVIVMFKNVPCEKCSDCDNLTFSSTTAKMLQDITIAISKFNLHGATVILSVKDGLC
jgi:YgiT-type zinc finger domain-containing protein